MKATKGRSVWASQREAFVQQWNHEHDDDDNDLNSDELMHDQEANYTK